MSGPTGRRPTVALAITGHGFGHTVRSAEVARELLARGARVVIRADTPAWLFPSAVEMLPSPGWPLDVGVAQRDGLDLDIEETRRRWLNFGAAFDVRAAHEAAELRRAGADVLVGDIPPLAFAAAAKAGVPGVALGNFTWDWIYDAWPDFEAIVEQIRGAYALADGLLRLPLHSCGSEAFSAFRCVEDVPLVARRAAKLRDAMRQEVGIPTDARVVLLSFGGFDAAHLDLPALGEWTAYEFVLTPRGHERRPAVPPNVRLLPQEQTDYVSLLAACDAVVTKPGYGIVADALANRVPVLYTDRGPFREYPVLAAALEALGPARFVSQADVRACHLGPHLDALLSQPRTWEPLALDGAARVAERILGLAGPERNVSVQSARHAPC